MKTISSLSVLSMFALYSFGENGTIESAATIKSITVYNSSAEITYQQEISLPEGKSTVVFTDLSPFVLENTVKISISNPEVDIITTSEKINYTKERKERNTLVASLKDSITAVNMEQGILSCKINTLIAEKNILFKDESIGGVSKGVPVAEIEKASAFFHKRYYELEQEIFYLEQKEKNMISQLQKYKNQIGELAANTQKACSEIYVTVINNMKRTVVFTFKFLTTKGGWAPVYDFKYLGPDSPLSFIFRANVFNASGTSWENVNITLSTATPTAGFNTPSLSSNTNKLPFETGIQFRTIEVANVTAEYAVKHKYTIPSDSKPYLVDVESYTINASYSYLLIPKLDHYGFLMAKIPGWNKYNLIPGTTNIYNKGSFMGKTFLNTYAQNDTLSLYLGKDKNIQANIKETSVNNQQNILGNYYIDKTTVEITIRNNSKEKLNVELLDQVPIIDDPKTKFSLQNIELAIYNKQEGLLTWNMWLGAEESNSFDYKYEIKEPKDGHKNYYPHKKKYRLVSCPAF